MSVSCLIATRRGVSVPIQRTVLQPLARAALLFLMLSPLAQASMAQPAPSIAGQWMCATSPVTLRNLPGIPDGVLTQRIAYHADAQGRWNSNASLNFSAGQQQGSYRLRTYANGRHRLQQNQMVEQVERFALLPPFDRSTPWARTTQRHFNAWVHGDGQTQVARAQAPLHVHAVDEVVVLHGAHAVQQRQVNQAA